MRKPCPHDLRILGRNQAGSLLVWCKRCGALGVEWRGKAGAFRYVYAKEKAQKPAEFLA